MAALQILKKNGLMTLVGMLTLAVGMATFIVSIRPFQRSPDLP